MRRKSTPSSLSHASAFRRQIIRWFRRRGRDLPWRRTRNPYLIIVSEFMLQQTQVSRVEAYYHHFLERYPSIESLAAAAPSSVRERGRLGLLPRAVNLHRWRRSGARPGRGDSGTLPSYDKCPASAATRGCGGELRLRARDAGSGHQCGAVCFGERSTPHPQRFLTRRLWETAERILPVGARARGVQPGDHGAGALICTARVAKCGECRCGGRALQEEKTT